jgi:putative transposase
MIVRLQPSVKAFSIGRGRISNLLPPSGSGKRSRQFSPGGTSIEMFYNTRRRHSYNNKLSPVDYEKQYEMRLTGV